MLLLLLVSSKIGLWMGATPERLLKAENKKFSTMAIAGTQSLGLDEVIWQKRKWRNNSSSLISF
jgi:isochorismate synthase EntC